MNFTPDELDALAMVNRARGFVQGDPQAWHLLKELSEAIAKFPYSTSFPPVVGNHGSEWFFRR